MTTKVDTKNAKKQLPKGAANLKVLDPNDYIRQVSVLLIYASHKIIYSIACFST